MLYIHLCCLTTGLRFIYIQLINPHALLSGILISKCGLLIYFLQVWRELFSPLHALNFGIGGDTTCNVLWRLQNGELENIRPKVRRAFRQSKQFRAKSSLFTFHMHTFVPLVQNNLLDMDFISAIGEKKTHARTVIRLTLHIHFLFLLQKICM